MLHGTPFHPRTQALCTSYKWKDWNGYASVCAYDGHSEQEYYAFRHKAGLLDISPLRKVEVRGPDGGVLLSRVMTRDIERFAVGRVTYCAMTDEDGKILDDCTVARLGPEHWRVSTSELWMHWFRRHSRGLRVELEDSSHSLCGLALQGPMSRAILKPITAFDMDRMRFFRVRHTEVAGRPAWVSRTGYTGDLGYEIFCAPDDALTIWDALMASGAEHGITPCGLDALDVTRLEAGYVLGGIDYVCSRHCLVEGRKSSPDECGLGWTVDLDRLSTRFVGQEAVEAERASGSKWAFVGLDIHWEPLEQLYEEYGLPPHLAPVACRDPVPIYGPDGRSVVGQVTSTTWSPLLKQYIALGQVYAAHGAIGSGLRVEHTVEYERRQLPCTVVERPFFDPPRKRSTPARST